MTSLRPISHYLSKVLRYKNGRPLFRNP